MEIKIESGVPLTSTRRGQGKCEFRRALEVMEVGQSFVAPRHQAQNLWVFSRQLRADGKNFTYRAIDNETARVWRIA